MIDSIAKNVASSLTAPFGRIGNKIKQTICCTLILTGSLYLVFYFKLWDDSCIVEVYIQSYHQLATLPQQEDPSHKQNDEAIHLELNALLIKISE
jgi:hypothetical protein